ncbi:MAG: hypothetical protein AAFR16_13345 [Pseudomonadota bacterium]
MPPRIPAVFVFVVLYFAVIAGGGTEAPLWAVDPAFWPGEAALEQWHPAILTMVVSPTFAQAAAFLAAAVALPDAAWRPARSGVDTAVSWLCAAVATGALFYHDGLFSPGYGTLVMLSIGDAIASLGVRRQRRDAYRAARRGLSGAG